MLLTLVPGMCATARAQQEEDRGVVTLFMNFQTVYAGQHDDLRRLWLYLDQGTLEGAGAELLKRNGLFVGKLDLRFRKEFDAAYKHLSIFRQLPQTVMMPARRPQMFVFGPELNDQTLFLWECPDSFTGRHYDRVRFGMEIAARPADQDHADLVITPVLRHGQSLKHGIRLEGLVTRVQLRLEESLVIIPDGDRQTGLAGAFLGEPKEQGRFENFLVLDVKGIHVDQRYLDNPETGSTR